MAVYCTQFIDVIQSGDEIEVPPDFDGETDAQILARKANSHTANGWTVEWQGDDAFCARKEYSIPGCPRRKDRYFRAG